MSVTVVNGADGFFPLPILGATEKFHSVISECLKVS